jgi:very-short-patch-repair endonuclease
MIWRREGRAVEITVARNRRGCAGVRVRRATLAADEITTLDGIPVTTPARTLLDLAAILTPPDLERAANEAEVRRLTSPTSLADLVARYPRRPGTPKIRALLEARRIGAQITRQELEHRFLAFLDAHRIARPQTNHRIRLHDGTFIEADCHWPAAGLIVELDGAATHDTRGAFERDRARDRKTVASGHRVVRITWRQLHDDPAALAAELRRLLRARP